jgi:ABC-type transporter Mla subunit MlaD
MAMSRANYWKVGLFVLAGAVLAFATLLWLGTAQFRRQIMRCVTYVNEAVQGLEVGAPVKIRGVAIGSVSSIRIAPDRKHVELGADVYLDRAAAIGLHPGDKPLPTLRVQLASAGITGVKYLLADYFDPPERYPVEKLPFDPPPDLIYVPAVPSTMKNLEDSALEALAAIPRAVDRVSDLVARLDKTLTDADVPALSKEAREALHSIREKLDALDARQLGAKTEAALDDASSTLKELKRVAGEIDARSQPVKEMLTKIYTLAGTLEKAVREAEMGPTAAAIRAAGTGVADVSQGASSLSYDIDTTFANLRETAASLRRLATLLERDPQSLLFGKTPEQPPRTKQPLTDAGSAHCSCRSRSPRSPPPRC